jgi:hypothetical protein
MNVFQKIKHGESVHGVGEYIQIQKNKIEFLNIGMKKKLE